MIACVSRWMAGVLVALLAACASPPAEHLPGPKLLVVGVATDDALRASFEDAVVRALQERGVRAIASHPLLPALGAGARQEVRMVARANRADVIVAARVLGLTDDGRLVDRSPIPVSDMAHLQTFYAAARQMLVGAPAPDHEVLVISAYDTAARQLIWGGVSWTFELDRLQSKIDTISDMLADNVAQALRQRRS